MKSNYELFGREHGKGWNELVDKLISDLNNINKEWTVTTIKEKFGGLRFYTHRTTEEQNELIEKAEKDSYTICELCGEKGKLREDLPWIQTLCGEHYAKYLKEKLDWLNKVAKQKEEGT